AAVLSGPQAHGSGLAIRNRAMQTVFKICLLVAVPVFLKKQLLDGSRELQKDGLWPLEVSYVQGSKPTGERAILIEFWATWCGPCRQSIPHLNALYKKYKDKGLVIVGVTDEDNVTIRRFTKT